MFPDPNCERHVHGMVSSMDNECWKQDTQNRQSELLYPLPSACWLLPMQLREFLGAIAHPPRPQYEVANCDLVPPFSPPTASCSHTVGSPRPPFEVRARTSRDDRSLRVTSCQPLRSDQRALCGARSIGTRSPARSLTTLEFPWLLHPSRPACSQTCLGTVAS